MKPLFFFLIIILQVFSNNVKASQPVVLSDHHDVHDVRGIFIDFYEDPQHSLTIDDIVFSPELYKFKTGKKLEVVLNENNKSTYWLKIRIINNSTSVINWVAELYDFRIENLEVYTHHSSGVNLIGAGGAKFPFSDKNYKHKNFIYNIHVKNNDSITLYYRIRANKQVSFIGRIRSYEKLLEYSNTEYFCLALFYGVMLAMIFYNLFLFVALLDFNYLYYVLYVSSVGVYLLNNDGLGFQFLWPHHPSWNDNIFPIANFSMTIWALLYGRSFLKESLHNKQWVLHGFLFFIILKTAYFIGWIYYPHISNVIWIDAIPFLYIYAAGIISFISGYRMTRFYVLAFTLFFTGFIISILRHFQLIFDSLITVYSFNIGVLCEMILLSFALADRIKMITFEKEKKLNKTVAERNNALEKKNKELDNFVYRSSHDIKGPIKSVIGLANLGVQEENKEINRQYFHHILKSSKKLDEIVSHLLTVIEIKESKINPTSINCVELLNKVIKKLQVIPEYSNVKFMMVQNNESPFFSDKLLFKSAFENLLQHCLINQDTSKEKSIIKIKIKIAPSEVFVNIIENGLGIDHLQNSNLEDMLYNMNIGNSSSELLIYKAKIYIEKLEGSIQIKTKQGLGSNINISIKNLLHTNYPQQLPSKAFNV